MKTLFSVIGTADPMTRLGDGPMLHIVRHEKPEKVVLYLSPLKAGHQRDDGRYTRAIGLLCERQGVAAPVIELRDSQWQDVHRLDHYMEEFEPILEELCADGDEVLVNISSGTPGMTQALVALSCLGHLDLKMLQVATPRRGANAPNDREDPNSYDFDALWALNCEREASGENRVIAVEVPDFAKRRCRE